MREEEGGELGISVLYDGASLGTLTRNLLGVCVDLKASSPVGGFAWGPFRRSPSLAPFPLRRASSPGQKILRAGVLILAGFEGQRRPARLGPRRRGSIESRTFTYDPFASACLIRSTSDSGAASRPHPRARAEGRGRQCETYTLPVARPPFLRGCGSRAPPRPRTRPRLPLPLLRRAPRPRPRPSTT